MNVPYRLVIEPSEYESYAAVVDPKRILTLPFSGLGQGSIPARNWVWEHSVNEGDYRHWIIDDNIEGFTRLNRNEKIRVFSGGMFRAAEVFVERYENVALAGFNYRTFVDARSPTIAPYTLNTRIYSCILIKNDLPYRWRGRYNEDTDLSLRVLKDGWVTVLFNAFLCDKQGTMTAKGGNTESLYGCEEWGKRYDKPNDKRKDMAESLMEQHPDVVKIAWKWGRWQHHVDYRPFKGNKLQFRPDIEVSLPNEVNNFGMKLQGK